MKKINGGYKSLFEYLVHRDRKKGAGIFHWLNTKFYKNEVARYNLTPRGKKSDQLIGSFQSFADMAHDAQYTFKRYRSFRDFLVDLFQPLRGFRNILQGVTIWIGTLIYGVGAILSDLFSGNFYDLKKDLVNVLSWFIDGGARITRGITQILATPFTWFLKMLIRAAKTIKGTPDILENEDIRRLVASSKNENHTDSLRSIQTQLINEYEKHQKRGQKSKILSSLPDTDFAENVSNETIKIRKYIECFDVKASRACDDSCDTRVEFPDIDPHNRLKF